MFAGRPPFALSFAISFCGLVFLSFGVSPFSFSTSFCGLVFLSFGVSCLLAWLGLPFFVCHQHLWSVLLLFCHRHLCTVSVLHGLFCCIGIRARLSVSSFFLSQCPQMLKSILGTNCDVDRLVPWLRRGPVRVPLFFLMPGVRWSKMCTGQPSFCLPFGFYFSLGRFDWFLTR